MQLTVQQAAKFLGVNEPKIHEWIEDGEIPFFREQGRIRFNQTELLEWATVRGIMASSQLHVESVPRTPSLADALALGGVYEGGSAADFETAIRATVARLPLGPGADPEMLVDVMLGREVARATAVGDGIAIPHVRAPIVENGVAPAIALCTLQKPIDLGARDGKLVDTIFLLVSPTVSVHLQILARLAAALHDAEFKSAVLRRAPAEEILSHARRLDAAAQGRR